MSTKFGYRGSIGPDNWASLDPDWSVADLGQNQSPIAIHTDSVTVRTDLIPLRYQWTHDSCVKVTNNGCSPTFAVTPDTHFLNGGPLDSQYELVQYHIHFSSCKGRGSEHSINGKFYPAEIHFVHFKKSYGSFEAALGHSDGLAVVGAVLDIDDNANSNLILSSHINKLTAIRTVGKEMTMTADLSKYSPPSDSYYTYPGSLTTPACSECVVWIVLHNPIYVTSHAFNSLKSLESGEGGLICHPGNYRPIQELNGRTVYSTAPANDQLVIPN